MAEAKADNLSFKDFLVVVPLLGSAIALVYDVGYFYWIGISYYTLFSLSEHVVFALPALPVGLGVMLSLPSGYIGYKLGERAADKGTPPIPQGPISVEESGRIRAAIAAYRKNTLNRLGLFGAAGLVLSVLSFYFDMFTTAAIMGCISLAAICHVLFPDVVSTSKAIAAGYGIGLLLVSFAAGLDSAKWDLRSKQAANVVKLTDSELQGQLLRSGERGLLFYDAATKKISFLLWSDIKRLSTK